MRFGYSSASRIGPVLEPQAKNETYRWCLDEVFDRKTNYMEITYWKETEQIGPGEYRFLQIYPQEIKYNGQADTHLSTNHRIIFIRVFRKNQK
jgi:hypothetical protein